MYGLNIFEVIKFLVSMYKIFVSIQNKQKNFSPTCFKLVKQTLVAIGFDVFFKLLDTNRRNFELKCVILLSVNNEFSFRYKIIT